MISYHPTLHESGERRLDKVPRDGMLERVSPEVLLVRAARDAASNTSLRTEVEQVCARTSVDLYLDLGGGSSTTRDERAWAAWLARTERFFGVIHVLFDGPTDAAVHLLRLHGLDNRVRFYRWRAHFEAALVRPRTSLMPGVYINGDLSPSE